jgi:hypothetical protein
VKHWIAVVVATTLVVAQMQTLTAQGSGIRPLTTDTFEEAQKVPDINALTRIASPLIVMLESRLNGSNRDETETNRLMRLGTDSPFHVTVNSPFVRVATIAIEARRKYAAPTFAPLETENAKLVELEVTPGSSLTTADAIENVIIKRGAEIVRPVKTDVHPKTFETRMGVKKELSEGTFTFDFAAFEPTSAITLIMIGAAGNFELDLRPEELAKLR